MADIPSHAGRINMRPGSLAYRCRRCGEVFHPVHAPDGPTMIRYLADGVPIPFPWHGARPTRTEIHACSPVIEGVADFVGVQYDQPRGDHHGPPPQADVAEAPGGGPALSDQPL